jgi:hypothetical protein
MESSNNEEDPLKYIERAIKIFAYNLKLLNYDPNP